MPASAIGPNPDAIGGWIGLGAGGRVQRRELTVRGGHASRQLTWIDFGLARRAGPKRVIWPDGTVDDWLRVESDAFYEMRRGEGRKRWTPGPSQERRSFPLTR